MLRVPSLSVPKKKEECLYSRGCNLSRSRCRVNISLTGFRRLMSITVAHVPGKVFCMICIIVERDMVEVGNIIELCPNPSK